MFTGITRSETRLQDCVYLCHVFEVDGEKVDFVSHVLRCLDRRDVRVDENALYLFLPQSLDSLQTSTKYG